MIEIQLIEAGPLAQNCRLLIDSDSREAVIFDPGGDGPALKTHVKSLGCKLTKIILTHSHFDHIGGVADLLRLEPKPQLIGSSIEIDFREASAARMAEYGLPPFEKFSEPDLDLEDGQIISFGSQGIKTLFTPGHSPGHFSFLFESQVSSRKHFAVQGDKVVELGAGKAREEEASFLIVGDLVFAGSVGRTDLPGGSMAVLLDSIKNQVYPLPDDTLLLSGHGPDTSLSVEKQTNPFLREL